MTPLRSAWVEVDLGAIARNVSALKALLQPGTMLMAVVKADGYGHGAEEVGRAALSSGADRLGVATVEEATRLRAAGILAPLQLLSEPPIAAASLVVEEALIPTVFTRATAVALSQAAERAGTSIPFHLKVDTGMNRIGVDAQDAAEFALSLQELSGLQLEGVFTHFAAAEVIGDWEFERQLERFQSALEALKANRVDPGIVHAANSAAAILHPESHFGMVRCGISVYGLHPGESTHSAIDLEPAMSVKARVVNVRRIGMGDGVSYGHTFRAAAPTTIATLPLGYADGVHRVLSNNMRVLIDGERCPQVGRVCMDMLMVEVPRGTEVRVGDEAVLVGRQAGQELRLDELAEAAGTINYEMACAFSMRLERVFR